MLTINFIENNAQLFLKEIESFRANTQKPIVLFGGNKLADEIIALLKQQNIPFNEQITIDANLASSLIVFTEMDGEHLGKQLLGCVDLSSADILAPITDSHSSKNPLFLISIPKSGTHLIYEMAEALGYAPGVELNGSAMPQTWYCIEFSNSHTIAKDFFVDTVRRSIFGNRHHAFMRSPAIFIYRHPLDILLSEAHYYHKDGKTAFSGWFEGMDFEERISKLINDPWLLGSLRDRIGGFIPWLRFPNVIPVSFEELIGSAGGGDDSAQIKVIWSIMLKLQVSGNPSKIASKIFNPNSPTFRSGKIGGFLDYLSPSIIERFLLENNDIMEEFGYDKNGHIGISNRINEFLHRELKKSKSHFSDMPLTVKMDFLNCNLVLFNGEYYAVPYSAGEIHIETISKELLDALPKAHTLDALQNLLILGTEHKVKYENAMVELGNKLKGKHYDESCFYWKQHQVDILFEYQGYNLISYQDSILALKQSIGTVNLTESSIEEIVLKYGSHNVINTPNLVQAYRAIDLQLSFDAMCTQLEEITNELTTIKNGQESRSRSFFAIFLDYFSKKY